MDSFQAKIGRNSLRKRENKNYRSVPFLPNACYKISKKQPKNSKYKKNTNIASFLAKIGWKSPRKKENKNFRAVPFLHDT